MAETAPQQPTHQSEPVAQKAVDKVEAAITPLTSGRGALDTFGIAIFFIVVLQAAGLYIFNIIEDGRIKTAAADTQHAQETLSGAQYKNINTEITDALLSEQPLTAVLGSKVQWSKFYEKLNAVTPKNVWISNLSIDEKGSARFDGTTPTLSTLAQAIVTYQKGSDKIVTPFVTDSVQLVSHSMADEDGHKVVKFSMVGVVNTSTIR